MLGRFELHCHTYFSRGRNIPTEATGSPEEMVRKAKEKGLTGLAITDHNSVEGLERAALEAKRLGLVFIPGTEVNSRDGHIVALGVKRKIREGMSAEKTIKSIHKLGGIAVAVHPYDMKGEGLKDKFLLADAVEVFNSLNIDRLSNPFAGKRARQAGANMVAGSDAHTPDMVGCGTTLVDFAGSGYRPVLDEIKRGKAAIDADYVNAEMLTGWVRERFIKSYSDVIRYIHLNYSPPKAWLAKNLLRRYVVSRSGLWNVLGKTGIAASSLYSGLKLLSYI